jgi:hypothetical protein
MKPRQPNLEWIRKVLADLEHDRGNPQIAAAMDRQMGGHQTSEPAEPPAPSGRGIKLVHDLLEGSAAPFKA